MSFATSGAGWGQTLNSTQFPDPFCDYASLVMPEANSSALRWCEYVFMAMPTYREATRRLLSYFITDVELREGSDDVKENWKKYLEETLDIRNLLHVVGMDLLAYGNSFTSVIPTFTRYLMCPKCRQLEAPLREIMQAGVFQFSWSNFEFHARCPKCRYQGTWLYNDRPAGGHQGFRIRRWSPHDIEILNDEWTHDVDYIWKIPEDYRRQVREGKPLTLENAPRQVIQAVKNNNHLLLEKDFIYHMREQPPAGIVNRGWGISRVLTNFRQAWYVQVLHRYNEAIALDYVIPFRLITPVPGDKSSGADMLLNANAGGMMAQVRAMIQRRSRDPVAWHTLPFPVEYKAIGGDAKALCPADLLNQGTETLLNAIGVPAELYRGSLTVQALPAALRLFEASNASIQHNLNGFLRFVTRKSAGMLRWDPVVARLMRVTHADDANRQLNKLQMAASGQVSQSTALKTVGLDYKDEVRQMSDDQRFQAEEMAELQQEMDQAAQMKQMAMGQPGGAPGQPGAPGGAPGGGGAPAPGGGGGAPVDPNQPGMAGQSILAGLPQGPNQQITPEEQLTRAVYMADQLLGMPESQKDSELGKLKNIDPNLHAIVRAQMDDKRRQARLQGGNQVMAQTYGKQGSALQAAPPGLAAELRKQAASVRRRRAIRLPK